MYAIQKKVGDGKWEEVSKVESLDDAIRWAVGNERHAPAGQPKSGDVSVRILEGRKVIWK